MVTEAYILDTWASSNFWRSSVVRVTRSFISSVAFALDSRRFLILPAFTSNHRLVRHEAASLWVANSQYECIVGVAKPRSRRDRSLKQAATMLPPGVATKRRRNG